MSSVQPRPAGVRQQQREESRAAVLVAAAELFSRSGYQGAAIDEIASASGIRKNNLLYHFASKEVLWKETVDWVFAEVDAYFADVRAQAPADPWAGFEAFVRRYFEVCQRHPAYVLIPMLEGVAPGWRADFIAERHLRRHIGNFDAYVRELVADEVLPPVEPLHLQNMLTGGAQLFLALAPLWRSATGADTQSADFIETYARSVLRLLKATRPKRR